MVKAVVGANWGDEGKGKITDMLGKEADIIVRFQGGANAGHTIVNDYDQHYRKRCGAGYSEIVRRGAADCKTGRTAAKTSCF